MIIDFHAHAFPDFLAPKAMAKLIAEAPEGSICAYLDGTIGALLGSMDEAGIDTSVVASICTKPAQFAPVIEWSEGIRSKRIIPFPSVHPEDPKAAFHIEEIATRGFKGIKLHPYYQGFAADEARMEPIYTAIEETGLVLLLHAGYDVAFPRDPVASPARIARMIERHPRLKLVAAHLGAWMDWEAVLGELVGSNVYLDLSYAIVPTRAPELEAILAKHPADRILFGSDSPWANQAEALAELRGLGLSPEALKLASGANAVRLLSLSSYQEPRSTGRAR